MVLVNSGLPRERICPKNIYNLGKCLQKCSPALFSAEEVERISV
jgi:hypothetical protein